MGAHFTATAPGVENPITMPLCGLTACIRLHPAPLISTADRHDPTIVGAALVVCGVYKTVRCLSAYQSVWLFHPPAVAACGGFATVGPAGRKTRSTAARPARAAAAAPQRGARQRMRAVPRLQRALEAEHRLVSAISFTIQYNAIQYKICKAPCCRGFRGAGEQDS